MNLKFGDIFNYNYGFGCKLVFLHESRKGELVFGTNYGGRVVLSREEFDEKCSLNLIKEL